MPRRRTYQLVFGLLSLIPLVASTTAIALGTGRVLDEAVVDPGLDHQLRYLAGVYLAIVVLIWWSIANIERARTAMTFVATAIVLGGIGRGVAIVDVGAEPPISVVFLLLEVVVVPGLIAAYRRDTAPEPEVRAP